MHARTSTRRVRRHLFAVAALVCAAAALASCAPPPPPPPTVLVYGDSLTVESRVLIEGKIVAAHPGWRVVVRSHGGTAQCDWHRFWESEAQQYSPKVVVFAFAGNYATPCATSRKLPDLYGADARWASTFWAQRGAELVFIGAPPYVGDAQNAVAEQYRAAAAATGVTFHSTNNLFVDPVSGVATQRLPCLPGESRRPECTAGTIQVRNPDGVHLCPTNVGADSLCPVHSAGADRYATAIATAAGSVIK